MAYTNPWNGAAPTDNDLAASIDDLFRSLKVDFHERMNVIFEDWTADPLVPKQSAFGAKTGKVLLLSGLAFRFELGDTIDMTDTGIRYTSGSGPGRAALVLPNGVTITKIEWLVTNEDTGQLDCELLSFDFSVALTPATESSLSTTASGTQIVDSGAINIVTVPTKMYLLRIDKSGGAQFTIRGVKVTYDTPDSTATL